MADRMIPDEQFDELQRGVPSDSPTAFESREIDPRGLGEPFGMSDQEIRARALECALRYMEIQVTRQATGTPEDFGRALWGFADEFADYIRNGNAS